MNIRKGMPAALALIGLCFTIARGAEFFVSPNGDDANPGTLSEPFATIAAAVEKLNPGDTLLIRGGTYRESVVFPRSGTAENPITIKAYRSESAIITGCDPVNGWRRHEGNIWKAPMPWTLGPGRNQVFENDRVLIEARHPNKPAPGLEMYVADLSPLWPTYGEFSIPTETRVTRPGRIVSRLLEGQPPDYWKGAIYGGVHFEGWCTQTGIIESSRDGEIEVGDRTQGWWFGSAYDGRFPQDHEAGRGMIVGHMHALDAPGEWHWENGTLYLMTPDGSSPSSIAAKRRQLAFDLSGRGHIRLEGLTIRGASMRLQDSAHCTMDRCDIAYVSHYTRHYGIGQIEKGRDTIKSGETGIFIGGHDNAFLNCSVRFSAGAGFHIRGYHQTIHNCLIDEVSYVGHYLNAITDAVGDYNDYENFLVGGHVITFNTMRNASRHFFNFYGNGTSIASRNRGPMDYAATLFAHNHLYNGMLLTRDAGFLSGYFCSGGTLNGQNSQVAYNVMHDYYDISAMRWNKLGIVYLDEGTCDVDLHHNLLWGAPGSNQRDMWFNTCCVDIREHDNVFHGLFTRNSATLRADDFPGGRPFRFGHDFERPPALPRWPLVVAQPLSPAPDSLPSQASDGVGPRLLRHGDWLEFPRPSDGGWQSAVLSFASSVKELNTDRSARATPRHKKATDPLVLEAKFNDGAHDKMRAQWTFLHNIEDGAWIRFAQVPLGEGYGRFRAVYGNDGASEWRLEVRLDNIQGPLVGESSLVVSDRDRGSHVQIYREAVADLSPDAKGTRDVFLVFRCPGGKPTVDFEYFRFEKSRGELPLQKNEVKFELRTRRMDGPKIGEFYPRFTGADDAVREFVATLEEQTGAGPLFLVVRSAVPKPVGIFRGLRLEKGMLQMDGTGIGVPPRRDWWGFGRWIFPSPTHVPQARPADHFREASFQRTFHVANQLAARPVMDGSLGEWQTRDILLKRTLDGVATDEFPARAWAGSRDGDLYLAVSSPTTSAKLSSVERRWGASDAVEIALQNQNLKPAGPIITLRGWPDGIFAVADVAGIPDGIRKRLQKTIGYRAAVEGDSWTCEWRVPFDAPGLSLEGAPTLACNITIRDSGRDIWRTWSTAGGATYDLHNGGTLLLGSHEALLSDELKAGLEVWLDASDASTIEKDGDGRVRAWKDKSGKGRIATQADIAFCPSFDSDALNGKAGLRFDDVKRTRLDLPDISDRPINATIFAVVSNPEPGLPQNHNPRILTASNGKEYDYLTGLCCSISGVQTGGPRQIVFEGKDRWAKNVRVGCFSPNYQTYLKGWIGEILVFGRTLTPKERFNVTAYLAGKWDL